MSRLVGALVGAVAAVAWTAIAMSAGPGEGGAPVIAEWQAFIQAVAEGGKKVELPKGTSNAVQELTKFPDAQRDELLDWMRGKMTREILYDKFDRVGRYQAFERCLATGTECDELRKLAARGDWVPAGSDAAGAQPPAGAAPPAAGAPPAESPPQAGGTSPATPPPAAEPVEDTGPPDPTLPVLQPNETACCRFTNPFSGGPSCSSTQNPRDCRDRLRGEIMLKHSCVNDETCVAD
jgi:hypothetical protein